MNKKNNNKGFTLAELLIVVAIIAVLVAIAIPVFTTQLEKSREATDMANIRSAYAEVMAKYLEDGNSAYTATVSLKQAKDNWQNSGEIAGMNVTNFSVTRNGSIAVKVDATGKVTISGVEVSGSNITAS